MNNIKKLADIQYLINETYSDKEPLTKEQKASKKIFNEYCEDIRKDLVKLDDIENQPCIEGYKERTSKNVLYGLHSLCLKGTNRAYWGMVRHMVEQIEKDLDVLEIIKKYPHTNLSTIQNYIESAKLYGWVVDKRSLYNHDIDLTEDEFSKVKEWIEKMREELE